MTAAVVSSPSPLWYATRGSGIVAFVLLTITVCLGVAGAVDWRGPKLPRFALAGLHRNVALLAVVFLALHVATTVADTFTPIGIRDAFVPFLASYRPIWLGLGTIACDLLLALALTSLLRVRIGYRIWRATHWLAYLAWPIALVHTLGTGSDARFEWMAVIAGASIIVVVTAVILRAGRIGFRPASIAAAGVACLCAIAIVVWYRSGPARRGWASRSGTPARLLASAATQPLRHDPARPLDPPAVLPPAFSAHLSGHLRESARDNAGLVTVDIDARLSGHIEGELRLALRGTPEDGGGIAMRSSGADFQATQPTPIYEGSIVALDGPNLVAELRDAAGATLRLAVTLRIDPATGAVSGSVRGRQA